MPYFKDIIAFAVLLVVLEDLLGFRFLSDGTQRSETETSGSTSSATSSDGGAVHTRLTSWQSRVTTKRKKL